METQLNADKCSKCEFGYYVSADGLLCLPYPNGILGCIEYKTAVNCYKCDKGMYLAENIWLPVEDNKLVDECLYYNSD